MIWTSEFCQFEVSFTYYTDLSEHDSIIIQNNRLKCNILFFLGSTIYYFLLI